MSDRYGCFLDGLNVIIRPRTGGKIHTSGFAISTFRVNTDVSALGSDLIVRTIEPIATTDATATTILSISIAVNQVLGGEVIILGKKAATTDAYVGRTLFSGVNNAGTTAALATASNTALENSAGTPAITAVANDTTDAIDIKVAGIAAENWTWTGYVHYRLLTVV